MRCHSEHVHAAVAGDLHKSGSRLPHLDVHIDFHASLTNIVRQALQISLRGLLNRG
jgi:hypothetical protein